MRRCNSSRSSLASSQYNTTAYYKFLLSHSHQKGTECKSFNDTTRISLLNKEYLIYAPPFSFERARNPQVLQRKATLPQANPALNHSYNTPPQPSASLFLSLFPFPSSYFTYSSHPCSKKGRSAIIRKPTSHPSQQQEFVELISLSLRQRPISASFHHCWLAWRKIVVMDTQRCSLLD